MFAEAAEPAEQMGIAAQLGEVEHLRELGLEIGKEVPGHAAIVARRAGDERGRESLDTQGKKVTESEAKKTGAQVFRGTEPCLKTQPERDILRKDELGV